MDYRSCYVYLLTTKNHNLFYTGFTKDLCQRIWEHKNNIYQGFTSRYSIYKLVYFEMFYDYDEAVHREKKIKRYPRKWKRNLIQNINPRWEDLFYKLCEDSE